MNNSVKLMNEEEFINHLVYNITKGNIEKCKIIKVIKGKIIFKYNNEIHEIFVNRNKKGNYTLYKSVRPDLTDFYSGKYQYEIGKGDMDKSLKKDQVIDCGEGWHFSNLWYSIWFSEKRPHKIISATVNIKDILSVHQKVRVRKFSNVQEVKLNWNYKGKG